MQIPSISVIIPTTGTPERSACLVRATESALRQRSITVQVIVVANGAGHDEALGCKLRDDRRLCIHHRPVADVSAARHYGRSIIETDFFAFLDDDDELLPDTLRSRVQPLLDDPDADIVVSNGYRSSGALVFGGRSSEQLCRDPLGSLLDVNWLPSCGGIFRTDGIGPEYFEGLPRFFEWTYLAFKLASDGRRISFVTQPAYRLHDTPGSVTKTADYRRSEPEILRRILEWRMPPAIRRELRKRLSMSEHALSDDYLARGDIRRAWRHHVQSMRGIFGTRYIPYGRRILWALIGGGAQGERLHAREE